VDLSYIKLPVFNNEGKLIHKDATTIIPGLHFLGYPWLLNRQSAIIFGIRDDVKFIVDRITNYQKEHSQTNRMTV